MASSVPPPGFLWLDYETFGRNPRVDRPSQFAAIRTDTDLNEIGTPVNWYCQPAAELIPSPDACLLTGITPQRCQAEGLPERTFAARILETLQQPNTCAAGYNSIRFDDEVTRFLLYRNLLPVYDREWRNGNSRWDLLDVMRLSYALRPEGIEWPTDDEGTVTFRLEKLAAANGLLHGQAHDALADVRATIGLARRVREAQPRLFDWALKCRDKHFVKTQIPVLQHQPFVHVSGMIPASRGCLTVLLPLMLHPQNPNEIVCFDLQEDPAILAGLTVDDIRYRLFTPREQLVDVDRLPLKSVHTNKCPMVGPMSLLTESAAERLGIDRSRIEQHSRLLPDIRSIQPVLEQALARDPLDADPEQALYAGFVSDADQARLRTLHSTPAENWLSLDPPDDRRLQVLWRRFVARYYPGELPDALRAEWRQYLSRALTEPGLGSSMTLEEAEARLQELRPEHPDSTVLQALSGFLSAQRECLQALTDQAPAP